MIFIAPLRNVLAVIVVCNLVATAAISLDIGSKVKREKAFLVGLTETLNEQILEITGDPSSRITVDRLRQMLDWGGVVPLSINGVPGVGLHVEGERYGDRQVVATVAAPDFGLESFDVLLKAEEQRKS
jgi:hypothetical protein